MELVALMNGRVMGTVLADTHGHPRFEYDAAWRDDPDAFPLSLSLPLSASGHSSRTVEAVLWGLLPDNERVLQRWSQRFHVSPRNAAALLSHVGEDCAGAIQLVLPQNLDAVQRGARDGVEWISDESLAERLRAVRTDAGASRMDRDTGQFSLPGAQPKIALLRDDGGWGIPSGRIPTTHILKPPTGTFEGYAQNEHFCLRLAAVAGLRTCESTVMRVADEIAICVRRYDRAKAGGTWHRLHQEDACQALGIRPEVKYQNDGGPSPEMVGDLLRTYSSSAEQDHLTFFVALVFNWLIGGSDAHAKNYSLLLGAGGLVRLAPLYDVSSALPYDTVDRRKLKLAMKIGSTYRWHDVRLKDWLEQAKSMGLLEDDALAVLDVFSGRLPELALQVADEVTREGMGHPIIDRLVEEIAASSARCRRLLLSA